MCGFTFIRSSGILTPSQVRGTQAMTESIIHRGPDEGAYLFVGSDGSWITGDNAISEAQSRQIHFAMGFRRLAILDLSENGRQPMVYLDRYALIFNGEIYNYLEIKEELLARGYHFNSSSDTEVIMAAYDCWGTSCFNRFNGMWAIILYDRKTNEVVICRDRFGVKPLYYHENAGTLYLVSEIKQLLAVAGHGITPNEARIRKLFDEDTVEFGSETDFTGVFRFPEASYAVIGRNQSLTEQVIRKYYHLPPLPENDVRFDPAIAKKYADEYYQILKESVRLRLRADVEVGTCLSGGLDSSSIVYVISELKRETGQTTKQKTFSLVFKSEDTRYCDESSHIETVTKNIDVDAYQIEPKLNEVLAAYPDMVRVMDNIQHSTLMSYLFTYRLVKSKGVTVTLDGQGADELQAGYMPYLVNHFSNLPLSGLRKEYREFKKNEGSLRFIGMGIAFNLIRRVGLKKPVSRLLSRKFRKDPFISVNAALLKDFNENLKTLLHYGDRGAMLSSVESRFPFLDYRMVEFWMKLPTCYKLQNGYTKYIARLAFAGRLPDSIVWRRQKMGWEIPQWAWLKAGMLEEVREQIRKSAFVRKLGKDHVADSADIQNSRGKYWKQVVKSYNAAIWHRLFFTNRGSGIYVVTPAKNEGAFIRNTLQSMVGQKIKPEKWVIVDDGSEDETGNIVREFSAQYPWIQYIKLASEGRRSGGEKVVRAFYAGFEKIKNEPFGYIAKLDADLTLPPDYFEMMLREFERSPKLGICGGTILNKYGENDLRPEATEKYHVRGALKMLRRECWDDIGGFKEIWNWDGLDIIEASYKGWETVSIDVPVIHHRPTTSAYDPVNHAYRSGFESYRMGSDLPLALIRSIVRLKRKPFLRLGFAFLKGYVKARFDREPQYVSRDLGRFANKMHYRRIFKS